VTLVVAAIVRSGRTVLLAQRPPEDPLGPLWEFPGGKVEPGESPEASLQRELFEELGIRVEVGPLFATSIHDIGRGAIRLLAYEVLHVDGEPTPTVHQALAWAAPGDLTSFDLLPADVPIAQALADADA
jgi:8-oxo-dGTP diphosphatase